MMKTLDQSELAAQSGGFAPLSGSDVPLTGDDWALQLFMDQFAHEQEAAFYRAFTGSQAN